MIHTLPYTFSVSYWPLKIRLSKKNNNLVMFASTRTAFVVNTLLRSRFFHYCLSRLDRTSSIDLKGRKCLSEDTPHRDGRRHKLESGHHTSDQRWGYIARAVEIPRLPFSVLATFNYTSFFFCTSQLRFDKSYTLFSSVCASPTQWLL